MTIQTKYNIGDEVWFIFGKEPRSLRIKSIRVSIYDDGIYEYYEDDIFTIDGEELASTKEELLKML